MPRKSWFNFVSKSPDNAVVMMYGAIGKGGVTAADFLQEVKSIMASKLTVRMHSPGGNTFDGMMIYEGLKECQSEINFQVDGVAASIASTICMAGKVTMAKSAMMMIHDPYTTRGGTSSEMRSMADALDQIHGNMVDAYAEKTKMPAEDIVKMMKAETWMNAEKAKAMGFCDCIGTMGAINAAVDFSGFTNVPEEAKAFFSGKEIEPATERELEQLLRDAGVSNSRAKAAVAAIKGDHRDDGAKEKEDMRAAEKFLASLKAATAATAGGMGTCAMCACAGCNCNDCPNMPSCSMKPTAMGGCCTAANMPGCMCGGCVNESCLIVLDVMK